MNELQQLLAAMGCSTPTEALASIAQTNTALASIQAATGRANATEALANAQELVAFARQVEQRLGATGAAALGRLEAAQASAARTGELETQLGALRTENARRDAALAMDTASADGRLPPALRPKAEEMFAKFGAEALASFLDALPKAGPRNSGQSLPQRPVGGRDASEETELTADELAVAKATGKTAAEMLEAKKVWAKSNGEISDAEIRELNTKNKRAS